MSVDALLRQVVLALDSAGVPFMLTGSLAAAYHGAGRATMDIDLVIAPSRAQLGSLLDALSATGHYVSRDAAKEALAGQGMFNVIDTTTGWKADLIIRRARTFSETEFARRRPAEYEGCPLWVATVEDVILAKLEWARMSGSSRQLEDVVALLRVQESEIDRDYLERWIPVLEVSAEWARVLTSLDRER